MKRNLNRPIKFNPPQVLALIFILLVVLGGLLLKLPIAAEKPVSWIDAFFIAASAATVTGLTSVDPGSTFTTFGEVVIMLLIQVGGLGIMTFAILVMVMLRKKIGFRQRLIMQEALNQPSIGGIIRLVRIVMLFSFSIEAFSVFALSLRWAPEYGWGKGIYYALFHTIAAFNNAGFALWPDNLSSFEVDPVVNLMIAFLIIVGGLGFTVMADLFIKNQFHKLTLHTKVMVFGTIIINVIAFLFILATEYDNPKTLGGLSGAGKLWGAFFQAITTRTAGFNTIDITGLEPSTSLFMMFLMFVGAGSTSTGGGIKLTTFVVIILAVTAFLKGKSETNLFKRRIQNEVILRSVAIAVLSFLFVFLMCLILSITEKGSMLQIMFEVVSAFGTVGLTLGLTSSLSIFGKCVIILVMLFGKLGPLTIAFSLTRKEKTKIRYPNGDIYTG
ncbi:TrkH family potassium uptake protein [Cytobacillus sp. Hz8]|uniref:TrkH family potassium uptake protein n=1 Tax=Cytobacillus sp. Hz8 TaxID=3347168 RepID=UPI0035D5F44A